MKNTLLPWKKGWMILFTIMLSHCIPLSLSAQLPANVEQAYDEYSQEILKAFQVIETEEPAVALDRIDAMLPQIEEKAKRLVDLAMKDPEAMRVLDSDDSYLLFQEKPYFKEILRIASSEEFLGKLQNYPELAAKLEEAEEIIAAYEESLKPEVRSGEGVQRGTAYSMSIQGSEFAGRYEIVADFEENAVAYIDDMGYLRIDILGNENGAESSVSFFVENTGEGRQEWATDGHFMYERLTSEGDLEFTLWGSEEQGYFEITSVRGPGSFVKGNIHGTCLLGTEESEEEVTISAEFQVKYINPVY